MLYLATFLTVIAVINFFFRYKYSNYVSIFFYSLAVLIFDWRIPIIFIFFIIIWSALDNYNKKKEKRRNRERQD
jgi:hypothetical protein